MTNMMLNLDDFVRVTQETGTDIEGRYDGVNYKFPHGHPVDVHKAVAVHIFGFGLPEISDDPRQQDKMPALLRLGWISSSTDRETALRRLRTQVRFEEIPPFPTVLRLRQVEENSGVTEAPESASRVPSSPSMGGGAAQAAASPTDPPKRMTLGLPKMGKN
jgi:hypothetical protein